VGGCREDGVAQLQDEGEQTEAVIMEIPIGH